MQVIYFQRMRWSCKDLGRCYDCPVKKCTAFSDGVYRVEVDNASGLGLLKSKAIKVIKIINKEN